MAILPYFRVQTCSFSNTTFVSFKTVLSGKQLAVCTVSTASTQSPNQLSRDGPWGPVCHDGRELLDQGINTKKGIDGVTSSAQSSA